jgi:hypothetical protein
VADIRLESVADIASESPADITSECLADLPRNTHAYVLICALRRIGLAHTQFATATCGTIRLKLLKIGALVQVSVRRVCVAMASACRFQYEFALAHAFLRRAGA